MNKIFLFFLLFVTTHSFSKNKNSESTVSKPLKLENSLLWKVEGEEIKTSYLFGTIHFIPADEFAFSDKVLQNMEQCQTLVLEMDVSDQQKQLEMVQLMQMPNGETLEDYCTPEEYSKLTEAAKSMPGMSIEQLKLFKPLMMTSLLQMTLTGEAMTSIEQELIDLAQQKGTRLKEFETAEFQLSLFDDMPIDEQIDDLIEGYIDNKSKTQSIFSDLVKSYKSEDLSAIQKIIKQETKDENFIPKLLDERNADWSEKVGMLCKEESCFIAVGAAHLPGQQGLIQLLRDKGYTVTAVE